MDLDESFAEGDFRERARAWLAGHVPADAPPAGSGTLREFELEWQRAQFEAGWAGVDWPAEHGGLGLSLAEQLIWHEEYALAGAPAPHTTFVGLRHAGPTLIAQGDERQKAAHLGPILRGDVTWCQGFSEPSAGSDLAALVTRAELDGDDLVVNGQKIWTSYGDVADFCELLVRTSPDKARHRGLSWVICDMTSPGIEVRAIRTITGSADFCEVFYSDVHIPVENVVGAIDDGWNVAMSTLSFERGTAFIAEQVSLQAKVAHLVDLARELLAPGGSKQAIDDDGIRRRLSRASAGVTALRAMTYAGVSRAVSGRPPGPEASVTRLFYGELEQEIARIGLELRGEGVTGTLDPEVSEYLWSFQASIAAGTRDIQRNIVAERILGLPR